MSDDCDKFNDFLNSYSSAQVDALLEDAIVEMQRWETLDAQLQALFSIMGNGVLNGWFIILPTDYLLLILIRLQKK